METIHFQNLFEDEVIRDKQSLQNFCNHVRNWKGNEVEFYGFQKSNTTKQIGTSSSVAYAVGGT